MKYAIGILGTLALLLCIAAQVEAGIILTTSGSSTGFAVSNTDLLQTNLSSSSVNDPNNIRAEEGVTVQSLVPLTNGTFGPADLSNANEVVAIHNGTVITYQLNTSVAPLGYNISNINTYAG